MFVCNGMIRCLAACHQYVVVVAKRRYMATCRAMFADLNNVGLYPVNEEAIEVPLEKFAQLQFRFLALGDHNTDTEWRKTDNWAAALYEHAGLPPSVMRDCFAAPRNPDREKALFTSLCHTDEPYIFVHDDKHRGFNIIDAKLPKDIRVVTPGLLNEQSCPSDCLLDYALIMERAAEIHVMDSCFAWMQELLDLNQKAYMHTYAKSGKAMCQAVFSNKWTFID